MNWNSSKMYFKAITRRENFVVQAKKSRFLVKEEEASAEVKAVKAIVDNDDEYTDKAQCEWKACKEKTCKNYSNNNKRGEKCV